MENTKIHTELSQNNEFLQTYLKMRQKRSLKSLCKRLCRSWPWQMLLDCGLTLSVLQSL